MLQFSIFNSNLILKQVISHYSAKLTRLKSELDPELYQMNISKIGCSTEWPEECWSVKVLTDYSMRTRSRYILYLLGDVIRRSLYKEVAKFQFFLVSSAMIKFV